MMFSRTFAMPSADTTSIPAIREWALPRLTGQTVDPFARNSRLANVTNDLNPETLAEYHMDAADFLKMLHGKGDRFDAAIFDPPYSPRQISECYQQIGRQVTTADTQNAALYRRVRDALDLVMKPGGVVLSFGWNTNGMGLKRGYEVESVMIVQHGGAHNDTLCMAERKTPSLLHAMEASE